ncbi:MAG: hypothetical protein IAE79_01760 [Anaerolinea sp.]|nr:hypothetical protein [Anaerolinea sp.]
MVKGTAVRRVSEWLTLAALVAVGLSMAFALVHAADPATSSGQALQPPTPNRQSPIVNPQSSITLTITADPPQLTVGDVVTLTVTAVHPTGARVLWPAWGETWGDLEIRGQRPSSTITHDDGTEATTQTLFATLWTPGDYLTPPLTVTVSLADGEVAAVTADPIPLTVLSVLTADDLTLRDIKPQASLESPPRWPWLLGGLLTAALLAAAGYWAWRRWPRQPQATAVPLPALDNRLPHEIALDELARIAALNLPAQSRFKEQYTLVSDALRRYLEAAFALPALDRTTAEIRHEIRHAPMPPEAQTQLLVLLADADLVKFAQVTPDLLAAQNFPAQAQQFILTIVNPSTNSGQVCQSPIVNPSTSSGQVRQSPIANGEDA